MHTMCENLVAIPTSQLLLPLWVFWVQNSPWMLFMLSIIDEFNCRTIKTCQSKDKGKDVMFHAESGSKKPWKGVNGLKKSVKCFNCHRKGHVKTDCWAKGGGKEEQGL